MPYRTSEKSNQRIENPSILRISGRILNISGLLFLRHFDYQIFGYQIFWLPNVPLSRLSMSAANQIMSSKRLESIPVLLFSSLRKPLSHMILVRVFVVTDWIVTKQVKSIIEFLSKFCQTQKGKVHIMQLDHIKICEISILLLTNNSFFCVSRPILNFQ